MGSKIRMIGECHAISCLMPHPKCSDALTYGDFELGVKARPQVSGSKTPQVTRPKLTRKLKIGPEVEDWFLKLGGVSWLRTAKIWQHSDATSFFHIADSNPSVNCLGPEYFS